jgi:hypothetical protein
MLREAQIVQRPLPAMPVEIEEPALSARIRRRLGFVHDNLYAVAMQHAGEHQATEPRADDGDVL